MKKILFLLLLTIYGLQAQTYQNPTYGTLILKTSPTVNAHPYLTTTESNGVQSKVQSVMNQNANTGLLLGGVISVNADPTKWNLAFGEGYVADPLNGTVAKVAWGTQSALTTPYLTTSTATYVLIANAGGGIGSVVMQNTPPTQQQYRTHVYLGKLAHTTKTTILFAVTEPSRMFDVVGQVMDLNATLKSINSEGNILSANGANLNLNISAGKIYRAGANYASDRNNPSLTTLSSGTAITFRNKFRDGSGGWTAVNTSTVDADHYDDGTGILAVVPNNKFTVRIAWRFGGTGTVHLDYGQAVYDNLKDAKESISTAIVAKDPDNVKDAAIVGYVVVKKGTAALNNTTENAFYKASMFGEAILTAGGTTDLNGAYNNSVSPQITTTTTGGAVAIKRGSAADTDNVLTVQNGAGTNTFAVTGSGVLTASNLLVNVKSYGALGNGTTNDSSAFQSANDYLTANGGGTLFVPRGTYIANFTIDSKVYVKGEGVNVTILKSANSSNLDVIKGRNFATLTGTAKQNPENRGVRYYGISDLTIDGNKANNTSGYGIRVWGCSTIWNNLIVQNCANDGIWTEFTSIDDPTALSDKSTQALESSFRNIKSIGNGNDAWHYAGPHDGNLENYVAFSNTGYAFYQTATYSTLSGRNWNSWLNGNSYYFGAGANIDQIIASGPYTGTGIEFGSTSGSSKLTNITTGGHITGVILRGSQNRIQGEISNCRDVANTSGIGVVVDGAIGCDVDIIGLGNNSVFYVSSEAGRNKIKALMNVPTGKVIFGGGSFSDTSILDIHGLNVVSDLVQLNTGFQRFFGNSSGNNNGIHIKSTGWDFNNRFGVAGTSGQDLFISQNFNHETSTRDNASYYTTAMKMDVVAGSISFMNGTSSPSSKMFIDLSGNIGVNTTSPSNKFDVFGTIRAWDSAIKSECSSGGTSEFQMNQAGIVNWTTKNEATTGDYVVSNGGYGEAFRIVKDTKYIKIDTPATSSSSYDILTRNSSTGLIEKKPVAYKVYTALISQSGTSAPTATILENTLGGTIVWTRTTTGQYVGTLSGAFTINKTWVVAQDVSALGGNSKTTIRTTGSTNTIDLITSDASSSAIDGALSTTPIEIRVYN